MDISPTWEAVLPFILVNLRKRRAYFYQPARAELSRMAEAAGADLDGLDDLDADCRSHDPARRFAAEAILGYIAKLADAHTARQRLSSN